MREILPPAEREGGLLFVGLPALRAYYLCTVLDVGEPVQRRCGTTVGVA
jgi:hypothetical protein